MQFLINIIETLEYVIKDCSLLVNQGCEKVRLFSQTWTPSEVLHFKQPLHDPLCVHANRALSDT